MMIAVSEYRRALVRGAQRACRGLAGAGAFFLLSCGTTTETVDGGIAQIGVTPPTSTITVGSQLPLQATVVGADGRAVPGAAIVWTVRDPSIASVSATGVVTGLAVGSTQVAANAGGQSAIAAITVARVPVASVVVLPKTAQATAGAQVQFTATTQDASQATLTGRTVTWTSSNTELATVNAATGLVTAVAAGVVTITATSEGRSDAATLTITRAPVATVEVVPDPLAMSVGQTTQLTAIARDADGVALSGRPVTWTSSNLGVATVSDQGVVRALSAGTTTLTAVVEGRTGTSTLTVTTFAVASVSVAPSSSTLAPRGSIQLTATVRDVTGAIASNRPIAWSSSNPSVATVSQAGLVTAVAPGNASITATSEGVSGGAVVTVVSAPIATLEVSPPSATLGVQQTVTLTVTAKDADGVVLTGRPVTFSSSNVGVATVSAGGVVTGVAPGSATITATSEGRSANVNVTVTASAVGSVTVAPATASINPGQTAILSATVRDANGVVITDRPVTWASSNTAAATVSSTGVVTGVAAGSATITATSEGKVGSATVTVTVATPAPVATVQVTPTTASVVAGQTTTLSATTRDANGAVLTGRVVTWTTSSASIATVSSSGVVTGVAPGTAIITATSEGRTGTSTVTVTAAPLAPVATVTVAPQTASIAPGGTTTLTATLRDANGVILTGRDVTWTTGAQAVAAVSSTGVVTGVAAGTATITATSEGKTGTATITVTAAPTVPVATVTVAPATASLTVLGTVALSATPRDANGNVLTGRSVTWSTSNPLVATVSLGGVVTGIAPGTATITATSEGKTGTSSITVSLVPVGSVTVQPATTSIASGSTTTLTATVRDANNTVVTNRPVTWTSSNPAVATVSSTGVVTGLLVGSATITATAEGKSGTSNVTVTAGPFAAVRVTPASSTVAMGTSVQLTAQATDAAGNVLASPTSFTWTTSDPSVANVSSSGLVTTKKEGTVTITASASGRSGTATITIQ